MYRKMSNNKLHKDFDETSPGLPFLFMCMITPVESGGGGGMILIPIILRAGIDRDIDNIKIWINING